jgi:hypothetical protein
MKTVMDDLHPKASQMPEEPHADKEMPPVAPSPFGLTPVEAGPVERAPLEGPPPDAAPPVEIAPLEEAGIEPAVEPAQYDLAPADERPTASAWEAAA